MTKDWAKYKDVIHDLYKVQGRTLEEVINFMKQHHNFTAAPRTYRQQFKKQGWAKYQRRRDDAGKPLPLANVPRSPRPRALPSVSLTIPYWTGTSYHAAEPDYPVLPDNSGYQQSSPVYGFGGGFDGFGGSGSGNGCGGSSSGSSYMEQSVSQAPSVSYPISPISTHDMFMDQQSTYSPAPTSVRSHGHSHSNSNSNNIPSFLDPHWSRNWQPHTPISTPLLSDTDDADDADIDADIDADDAGQQYNGESFNDMMSMYDDDIHMSEPWLRRNTELPDIDKCSNGPCDDVARTMSHHDLCSLLRDTEHNTL